MSRGYCYILAAVGWLVLAGTSPSPKAAPANKGQQNLSPSSPHNVMTPPVREYRPYADRQADDCYKTLDHEAADLCAQWRAAYAAEKAAGATERGNWIAGLGALLSFASVIFVLIALRQGRHANRLVMKANARATRRAVDSARGTAEALKIARKEAVAAARLSKVAAENGERELRAYLDFATVRIIRDRSEESDDGLACFGVRTEIKNFGKTPADNLRKVLISKITKSDGTILFDDERDREGLGSICPGDTMRGTDLFTHTERVWLDIVDGTYQWSASLMVFYTDAFGKPRKLSGTYHSEKGDDEMGFVPGSRQHD